MCRSVSPSQTQFNHCCYGQTLLVQCNKQESSTVTFIYVASLLEEAIFMLQEFSIKTNGQVLSIICENVCISMQISQFYATSAECQASYCCKIFERSYN